MSQTTSIEAAADRRAALVAAIDDFAARLNRGEQVQGEVVLRQLVEEALTAARSPQVLPPGRDGNSDEALHALISKRGPEVSPIYEYASVLLVGAVCREIERLTGTPIADLLHPLQNPGIGPA